MHKYLSLTRVLLKNTAGMISDGKTKKTRVYALYIFLGICFLPSLWLLYQIFQNSIQTLLFIQQEGTILALGFYASNMITFIFSIFLIPGVFYFSKDSETLLAYPLKPQTILGSKFTVCLFYEYIFVLFIITPLFIAYAQTIDVSFLFYPFAFLIFLTIPLYPLVLSSIITMFVMRFMPFFKNRDRFNMIAGIVSVVLALSLSFSINNASFMEDPASLLLKLTDGDNSLVRLFAYLFPGIPFAADALIYGDFVQLIIYLAISAASIVVFIFLGQQLYFKGAIGLNETGSNRKNLSNADMQKAVHRKGVIHTYMVKELRLIIRTPIYFLNCIGTNFIVPIAMAVGLMSGKDSINLETLSNIDLSGGLPIAIIAGLILGMFVANLNLISSTSISREGTNVIFMKYVPVSIGTQIRAKINCGILVASIASFLMIITAKIIIPVVPISFCLIAFLASLLTIFLGNYLGIMIDLVHPKLVWEQEAAAVKQNLSSMIAMLGGMMLAIALGVGVFVIPFPSFEIAIAVIVVILIILSVILYMSMPKIAAKLFEKL